MVLSLLVVCALAIEALLFIGKDYLVGTRRRAELETAIRQSYADLQAAQKQREAARAKLLQAIEEVEGKRAQMHDADRAFKQSQKILPTLVHTLGERDAGICCRAPIAKRLPPKPEPSQEVVWNCRNFVDVWTDDMGTARQMAVRQFPATHHYDVGEFTAVPSAGRSEEKAA